MKKSQLRKIIRESIKELMKESIKGLLTEKWVWLGNLGNYCDSCTSGGNCCFVSGARYGGTQINASCGGCPEGVKQGEIIWNIDSDMEKTKGAGIGPPVKSPGGIDRGVSLSEQMQMLTEEITCSTSNAGACIQFVKDCLAGGGTAYTSDNIMNSQSITIHCTNGMAPPGATIIGQQAFQDVTHMPASGNSGMGGPRGPRGPRGGGMKMR